MTKAELYRFVDGVRRRYRVTAASYPLDAADWILPQVPGLHLRLVNFGSCAVGGLLLKGRESIIALNQSRNSPERNFDFAHELMHYILDDPADASHPGAAALRTDPHALAYQDTYIEWRANEGAAELLMPYRLITPELCRLVRQQLSPSRRTAAEQALALRWNVTPAMIRIRIASLEVQLRDYARGTPLSRLTIQVGGVPQTAS